MSRHRLPVTYRSSRIKMVTLLAISAGFVAIGIAGFDKDPLLMGACAAFFALGLVVALVNLHPAASYLTLSDQGFEFSSMFRKHFVAWKDVLEFVPVSVSGHSMLGWNYRPDYPRQAMARRASSAIAGIEAALPDTYGHGNVELARLMNELRATYAG